MSARPSIQIDLRVDGQFLATLSIGSESEHPFTYERTRKSLYPAGDAALMLHYGALLTAGYDPTELWPQLVQLLYDADVKHFTDKDDLPW